MSIDDIKEKAEKLNGDAVDKVIHAEEKFEAKRSTLDKTKKFFKQLGLLFELIKDWGSGRYQDIPWTTIAAIAFAILYFINPYDAIPDFIPGVGYLDDAGVISLVLLGFANDVKNYINWKGLDQEEYFNGD